MKPSGRDDGILIGSIDAGTTGVRFVLFDRDAHPIDSAYRDTTINTPRPGWVEQDPEAYLNAALETVHEVLARRGSLRDLAAIGIANQRESVVCWDRATGKSLHPAIVWQDRRTARTCEWIRHSENAAWIRERTGLSIDPYFSASKMAWLLEQVAGLRTRAEAGDALFGTIDSWLVWHLTGEHVTDDTNASRTMLYDLHARRWDDELLSFFGIPHPTLPAIVPSLSIVGPVRAELGLALDAPVAGILGDQQASLLGQGIDSPGRGQATWGTGAFLLAPVGPTPDASRSGLLTTVARTSADSASYALEGSVFVAGAAVQWLRDGLGILAGAADSETMARSIDSTEGVVFVPALTGLGAPHWDPQARGMLIGLTRGTRRAHIVRAALEAIAFQTHDVVRAMERDCNRQFSELRVGGGAAANDFLCQFQSDILGIPVVRPQALETTALGAAYAAGMASGVWPNDTIATLWREGRRFEPRLHAADREKLITQWQRAVERTLNWHEEEA